MTLQGADLLDLPYKGERDYLRFADVFPALSEFARTKFGANVELESLTIRRPIRRGIQVSFDRPAVFVGSFRLRDASSTRFGWLSETDSVPKRVPYDSEPLNRSFSSTQGFACAPDRVIGHSDFDVLAGLMRLVSIQVNTRFWWWCQMDLQRPVSSAYPIEVRLRNNLGGRCLVFDIIMGTMLIGTARFIIDTGNV